MSVWLTALGLGLCNIDQPLLGCAVRPNAAATSPVGYLRLHGRNYEQWFADTNARDRYDYLYSEKELDSLEVTFTQRRASAQQPGIRGSGGVRAPNGGSPVAYGSLRAAVRNKPRSKHYEFRRFKRRMISCADCGGRTVITLLNTLVYLSPSDFQPLSP